MRYKFRAYCSLTKTMINDYCVLRDNEFVGYDMTNNTHYIESVMQFTGLYDKNGKEIYEGDIAKKQYFPIGANDSIIEYYKLVEVVWHYSGFSACHKINGSKVLDETKSRSHEVTESKRYKHPTAGLDWIEDGFYFHKSEIIGNIHENPELLEQK